MKKINLIVLIPYLLAIILSVGIIYLLPPIFEKYKFEMVHFGEIGKDGGFQRFEDLDSDGISEEVLIYSNINKKAAIKISTAEELIITQWNMDGIRPSNLECFDIADIDQNGYKEVFLATMRNDSVFLNYFEPMLDGGINIQGLFIDTIAHNFNSTDTRMDFNFFGDLNNDSIGEIYMTIRAGFARQPRAIYHINHSTREIKRTPYSGYNMGINQIVRTGKNSAILALSNGAPGNYPEDDTIKYHDRSAWLVCFDYNFKYLFPPIEKEGYPSNFSASLVLDKNRDTVLLGLFTCTNNKNTGQVFYKLDLLGNLLLEKDMYKAASGRIYSQLRYTNYTQVDSFLEFYHRNTIYKLNTNLEFYDSIEVPFINRYYNNQYIDLDGDGPEEHIFLTNTADGFRIMVLDPNFKLNVKKDIERSNKFSNSNLLCSLFYPKKGASPQLFVQVGKDKYFFEYYKNPIYFMKWISYSLILLLLFLFVFIVQRTQIKQIEKKQKLESNMLELQFLSMKSQMDPHFVFNVMNSVSTAILKEDKINAHRMFLKMTDLFRSQITRAREVTTSLKDEIDFCRNFLEVEQFRFKDKFAFNIEIEDNIDLSSQIPKMLVQIFTENALKHGIKPADHSCTLYIKAYPNHKAIHIDIDDNGIGRNAAKQNHTDGTGKGMKLIDEMIGIYQKLGHGKVNYRITDKKDHNNKATGTLVTIEIETGKM